MIIKVCKFLVFVLFISQGLNAQTIVKKDSIEGYLLEYIQIIDSVNPKNNSLFYGVVKDVPKKLIDIEYDSSSSFLPYYKFTEDLNVAIIQKKIKRLYYGDIIIAPVFSKLYLKKYLAKKDSIYYNDFNYDEILEADTILGWESYSGTNRFNKLGVYFNYRKAKIIYLLVKCESVQQKRKYQFMEFSGEEYFTINTDSRRKVKLLSLKRRRENYLLMPLKIELVE